MTTQLHGCPELGVSEADEVESTDDGLWMPILFDYSNDSPTNKIPSVELSSLTPPMWLHTLCGLPIGLAVPMSVRAFVRWFIRHHSTFPWSGIQSGRSVPTIIYALGTIVFLTNAIYVYIMVTRKTPDAEDNANVGTMIGFCCALLIIDMLWYGTLDMLPLFLVVMYVFADYKLRTMDMRRQGMGDTTHYG